MVKEGQAAPDFKLQDDEGNWRSLADYRGLYLVLYFYPKDMTPGCTTEACSFRDEYAAIRKKGAVVLGVSKDSAASHAKFKDKYRLPFSLLADEGLETIKAYGAWGERSLYGRKFMGI